MTLWLKTLYALIIIGKKKGSLIATESSIKFFIMGALASSVLLYGVSLIYGITGAFDFLGISQ